MTQFRMENATSNETTSDNSEISDFVNGVGAWYWVLRGLVGVIILAGNGPVIYLIVTCHRLHTISNWFILSLSLADLFVGLFLIPVSTSCALWTTCNFPVLNMCFDLLLFVSIANMCIMTADRYLSVVRPLSYFQAITNSRVLLWIVAAWVIPIIFSLIPLAWIFSDSMEMKERARTIYGTFQIIGFNVLPCVIMLLIYGHIFAISRKHWRQIRASTVNRLAPDPETINPRRTRNEWSSTRVFGLVVIFFLLCWMLSAYRHFCEYFKLRCPISFGTVVASRFLMVLNSAINPFIYAFLKEDIKREMKKRICKNGGTAVAFFSTSVHRKRNGTHHPGKSPPERSVKQTHILCKF